MINFSTWLLGRLDFRRFNWSPIISCRPVGDLPLGLYGIVNVVAVDSLVRLGLIFKKVPVDEL